MIFLLIILLFPAICFGDSEATIGGKTAQAHIVQNNGTSLRPRPYLNFTTGMTCTDTGGKTVCSASGGGGGSGTVSVGTINHLAVYGVGSTTVGPAATVEVAGNVGINSATPGQSLDVQGTVRSLAFIKSGGTSSQFLKADGSVDSTTYSTGSGTVGIGTTGRMAVQIGSTTTGTPYNNNIDANGNIGLGSATPGQLLDIQGMTRILGSNHDLQIPNGNIGIGTTKTTTSALTIMNGAVGIGTWVPQNSLTVPSGGISAGYASSAVGAGVVGGANGLVAGTNLSPATGGIISSGNVSIGTTATDNVLNVYAATPVFKLLGNTSGPGFQEIIDTGAATTGGVRIGYWLSGGADDSSHTIVNSGALEVFSESNWSGSSAPSYMKFSLTPSGSTSRSEYLHISSAGNVGIGTAGPTALLQVGTNLMNVFSGGNVGIGSAAPGTKLDVQGTTRLASGGTLIFQQGTAPTIANNTCGSSTQGTVDSGSTNTAGSVTVGTTSVTSCQITWNGTKTSAPDCICQDRGSTSTGIACTASGSTSTMTISSSADMSSHHINYFCFQLGT